MSGIPVFAFARNVFHAQLLETLVTEQVAAGICGPKSPMFYKPISDAYGEAGIESGESSTSILSDLSDDQANDKGATVETSKPESNKKEKKAKQASKHGKTKESKAKKEKTHKEAKGKSKNNKKDKCEDPPDVSHT